MKKYFTLLIALVAIATSTQAQVAINSTNFPDPEFRAWLLEQDYGKDGQLTAAEIADIKQINVTDHGGIKDLTGIGFFTAVELLACGNNQLTSLDLSKNTALKTFACHNNQLTTLDLSKNTALTFVNVTGNPLTSIDISTLKNLETLYCGRQDLSVINYTNNTSLKKLGIVNSDITTLDVSMLPELEFLQCEGCQLTTLDVSKNTKLNSIYCDQNHIRGAGMDALINSLPTVTNGVLLVYDNEAPDGNEMTTAQVAAARAKGWNPRYHVSPGTYADYEGVDASGIAIDATNFPDPEFRAWLLDAANINGYGADGQLTAAEIADIKQINVTNHGGIKDLTGIGFFTAVELLACGNNQLTSLDLSKNTALKTFACHNNQLTTLDLSKNTALTFVNVTGNPLTSIDISTLSNLETLYCGRQDLSVINYTNNTSLKDLGIVNSDITTLDVSMLPELETLQCEGCQLTTLDVSKNTKLNSIYCGRNHIRGAGMDALINSLPTVTNGGLYVYDNEAPDGNEMTTAQVAAARAKGWNPQYCVSPGTYVDYEGVDASGIAIDATNFPDPEFRTMLLLQDYGQDGLLTNDEIAALTFLDVYWTTIVDLKGIEFFTEVKELYCRNLSLETLDVSQLKKLETLMCQGNQLTSIKVSGCPALKELICYGNKLTSLDVSNVPNLQWLYCYDNNINETEMGKLVESLPTVEGGLFIVKNLDSGASDKNVITQEQVAAATAKHWAVQAMSNGKMEFYDGVPSGIEGVKTDAAGSGNWYMLDGQKLQGAPAKKGVYVQDGRKIIIK